MEKFGHLQEFNGKIEPITAYIEHVELYFFANSIGEDKRLAILLSVIGPKTYGVLRNLLVPESPQEKGYSDVMQVLTRNFERQRIVMAERFNFIVEVRGESVVDVAELR